MKILNIFDAAKEGAFQKFQEYYNGDVNQIYEGEDINLLCMAVTNNRNGDEKIKIIKFLLKEKININYSTVKEKRNALHLFYFCVLRPTIDYELEITRLFIDNGINLNSVDKYNAIPLKYAITINKLDTSDNREMYRLLLDKGSDYELKDKFGKSCLDYANEYSWRNDFIEIVEEYKNGNR